MHPRPFGLRSAMPCLVLAVALSASLAAAGVSGGERGPGNAAVSVRLSRAIGRSGSSPLHAWVYFKDKDLGSDQLRTAALRRVEQQLSAHTLWRRSKTMGARVVDETDLPVSNDYAARVLATGAIRREVSRYLNAVSVEATPGQLSAIAALPCVDHLDLVNSYQRSRIEPWSGESAAEAIEVPTALPRPGRVRAMGAQALDSTQYGVSWKQLKQIEVTKMHEAGYHGEGVLLCILDAGFQTTHTAFNFAGHPLKVAARRDFIQGDTIVSNQAGKDSTGQDSHGTYTLSTIGAYFPGRYLGAAYECRFLLGKTEWVPTESPVEEDHWLAGTEWADSLGADLISSSLGYREFEAPFIGSSYTYSDLDGHHAVTTRAASIAAAHGIVVINAMGNEGQQVYPGNKLVAPADADSIISSGAVDSTGLVASFSSRGPTFDRRIKPDIMARGVLDWAVAYSNNTGYTRVSGTSFSTPITAGAVALLLQKYPSMTPLDVVNAIHLSGDRFASPDTVYGWGLLHIFGASQTAPLSVDSGGTDRGLPGLSLGLAPNTPNPFHAATRISYALSGVSGARKGSLKVFDVTGRLVATLLEGEIPPGAHQATWDGRKSDGRDAGTGIYFYRLESGTQSMARRMILVR